MRQVGEIDNFREEITFAAPSQNFREGIFSYAVGPSYKFQPKELSINYHIQRMRTFVQTHTSQHMQLPCSSTVRQTQAYTRTRIELQSCTHLLLCTVEVVLALLYKNSFRLNMYRLINIAVRVNIGVRLWMNLWAKFQRTQSGTTW